MCVIDDGPYDLLWCYGMGGSGCHVVLRDGWRRRPAPSSFFAMALFCQWWTSNSKMGGFYYFNMMNMHHSLSASLKSIFEKCQ
jgi:hypothetical protein